MDDQIQKLAQEIETAFAGRPYPGDDAIARSRTAGEAPGSASTWERFRGKDWREVVSMGREHDLRQDVLALTPEGFAYYLPAFLIRSLDLDDPLGPDDYLVYQLWTYPEDIAPLLKPSEKRAVVRVLEYLDREYGRRSYVRNNAKAALDHYWAYFTDEELGISPHAIQK